MPELILKSKNNTIPEQSHDRPLKILESFNQKNAKTHSFTWNAISKGEERYPYVEIVFT